MKPRHLAFTLHRYIGLAFGLILVVVGLTGSLLVFSPEIDHLLLTRKIGQIIPSGQRLSIESALDTVLAAKSNQPELKPNVILTLPEPNVPYQVLLRSQSGERTEVNVQCSVAIARPRCNHGQP